MDRDN
jgi:hypothetical protein